MKRCIWFVCFSMLSFSAHAVGWQDLINSIVKVYGVNLDMKNLDIESLEQLKSLDKSLNGTHSYGGRFYNKDAFDWSANHWSEMLSLSKNPHGHGEMGETMLRLSRDFPIDETVSSPNKTTNEYYRLQAQTSLASRAASEVAYQQATNQEKTMQRLHDEIDQTKDQKSASDLNNRLVAENALTNVQQTKLLAVIAEQSALNAQEKVNRAKQDKAFFEMK